MTATEEALTTPTDAMSSWVDSLTPLMTDDPPAAEDKTKETPNADKTADAGGAAGAGGNASVETDGAAGGKSGAAAKPADEPAKPAAETPTEEDKWPRSAKDWEKFRTARKETETKLHSEISQRESTIKELQAQLSSAKEQATTESPQVKAEVEQLKKDNEEMSRRLQVLDVTQHPKFQAYFKNKVDAQVSLAKRIVGEELAKDIEAALALPDTAEYREIKEGRLQSVMENLSPLQASRIGSVLNAMAEIDREREGEISMAKESSAKAKALAAQDSDNTKRQLTQTTEAALNNTIKALQDPQKGSPLFQLREGDEAWNKGVMARVELARNLFYGTDKLGLNDYVNAAMSASAFPELMSSYKNYVKTSKEEIAKLQGQVKALTAAQPRRGETGVEGGAEVGDGKMKLNKEMSPMEVTQSWLKSGPWGD